jgi:hypothetical protein
VLDAGISLELEPKATLSGRTGMRRSFTGLFALLVLATACAEPGTQESGTTATMPDDFSGTFVYRNGTVPPPHHYEWQLRFTEADAELSWRAGYSSDDPLWEASARIDRADREQLYQRLREAGGFDKAPGTEEGMAGGPTGSVELFAGGQKYALGDLGEGEESQDMLEEVADAATDLLPAEVWTEMRDKQDALPDK